MGETGGAMVTHHWLNPLEEGGHGSPLLKLEGPTS